MEKNIRKLKFKKRLKFRHIYALLMVIATCIFSWFVLDWLVFDPMSEIGYLALGYRMEEITPIEDKWIENTETFAATVENIDYLDIFWNTGPVIFFNVRLEQGTSRSDGRRAARTVVTHFIEETNGVARQYDLQVVISYGLIHDTKTVTVDGEEREVMTGILADHNDAVIRHTHEFYLDFTERTLAHAEAYPSQSNVTRASQNLQRRDFSEAIIAIIGEEGLSYMRDRVNAIEVLPEGARDDYDNEIILPRYTGELQIPQSNIARFPQWGTWSNETNRIIWTP